MLYIIYTTKAGTEQTDTWHVGKQLPPLFGLKTIRVVQADGDELEHIIHNFKNIPYCTHRKVQKWTGDLANFIALNL